MNDAVLLSVVVVIGRDRGRAREMVSALAAQGGVEKLEVVIVDTAPAGASVSDEVPGLRITIVNLAQDRSWSQARYEGFRKARAPVIAFLEDHCIPAKDWAERIIAAHDKPWAAVGYSFLNGSRDTYLYRSIFMAEYGFWADPAGASANGYLPSNNVSYKRAALLEQGDGVEHGFSDDSVILKVFKSLGQEVTVEPTALVAHQATGFADTLHGHFSLARLSASAAYGEGRRSLLVRLAVALTSPLLFPPVRLFRLFRSLRDRSGLKWRFIKGIPVIYLVYQWAALGVSMGCLAGEGISSKDFDWAQLNAPRIKADFLE
ncbi:MAG: glycosyltransferase [Gammaproteobacteria bacterium]